MVKESACSVGDLGSILGLGRPPGEGHGNPLQDSCLENPMDRGVWWTAVHGATKSQTGLRDKHMTHPDRASQAVLAVMTCLQMQET